MYLKAQESGQQLSGASAMNEERIRQLEELEFVWALRGQESARKQSATNQGVPHDLHIPNVEHGQYEEPLEEVKAQELIDLVTEL
jgi:hypothetical protein